MDAIALQAPDTSPPLPSSLALTSEDILGVIFQHIGVDLEKAECSTETRKYLFRAAQTCKAFVEPALNSLWRVLPSLYPLLKLLPAFQLVNNTYVLSDVKMDEWKRFDHHTRRVRVLSLEPSPYGKNISPYVYMRITRLRSGPIIPALKELRIPANYNMDLSTPFIVLCEQLQVLELNQNTIGNAEFFPPFFSAVTSDSSKITHLVLRGDSPVDIFPILLLNSLQTLELHLPAVYFSSSFMEKLGKLEDLRNLTLRVGLVTSSSMDSRGVSAAGKKKRGSARALPVRGPSSFSDLYNSHSAVSPPILYPRLQQLHLIGSLTTLPRIMRYMSYMSLSTFILDEVPYTSNMGAGTFWMDCLETLAGGATSIKVVKINQATGNGYYVPLSAPLISPLLRFHYLEVLEINNMSFSASDSDFLDIVSAFSNLKKLSFPDSCIHSSPSLTALWQPAFICPTLKELSVCIFDNAHGVMIPPDLKDFKIRRNDAHRALLKLQISSSFGQLSDTDVIHFARIFDRAFPNLASITGFGPRASYESWSRVNIFREALQEIRREVEALEGV